MNNPVISNKHKVVLVYLSEIENVGDLILGDSVEWLIKRRRQDIELVPLNLIPSKKELLPKFYFNRLVSRILMSISKRVPFKDFGNMLFYFACKIMVEKYIDNKLKRGGG